jgi:endonuclease YncB( thermonuclease family)
MWMETGWPGGARVAEANVAPPLCIGSVHDGDTIRTCAGERVRIENIDAPELSDSPKCTDRRRQGWCDYDLAIRSRDELAAFLAGGHVTTLRSGTDRYGRTLARLRVEGRDVGDHLVELGLAKPWQ